MQCRRGSSTCACWSKSCTRLSNEGKYTDMQVWMFLYFIKECLNPKKPKMSVWEEERKGVGGFKKRIVGFFMPHFWQLECLGIEYSCTWHKESRSVWGTGAFGGINQAHFCIAVWVAWFGATQPACILHQNFMFIHLEIISKPWHPWLGNRHWLTIRQHLWQQALGSRVLGIRNGHRMIERNMFDSWLKPHNCLLWQIGCMKKVEVKVKVHLRIIL